MKKRPKVADARQTSFVVAKADVLKALDEERDALLERMRTLQRAGESTLMVRGALAAVSSIRDRIERLG